VKDLDDIAEVVRSQADRKRFAEVLRLARDMQDAEATFKAQQAEGRKRIREMATQCLQATDRGSDRTHIVRHLYWHVRAISAETMAEALRISMRQLAVVVGSMEYEAKWPECDTVVCGKEAYSRADLQAGKSSRSRERCQNCEQQWLDERKRHMDEIERAERAAAPAAPTA
jgi:hypothetical protein